MAIHAGDCSICLGDVCFGDFNTSKPNALRRKHEKGRKVGNIGERLKCGHMYHRKCILPWFLNAENEMSDTCPMCRQDIRFSNRNEMLNWRLFSQKHSLSRQKQYNQELDEAFWDDEDDSEISTIDNQSEMSTDDGHYNYLPRNNLEDYEQIFDNRPFQNIDEDDWIEMIYTIRTYFASEEDNIEIESGIMEFIMRIDDFLEDNQPLGSDSRSSSNDDQSESTSSSSLNHSNYVSKTNYSYRSELRWIRGEEKAYRRKFYEKKTCWRPTHSKFR